MIIKHAVSLLFRKANPALVQWSTIKLLLLHMTCHKPGRLPGRQLASAGIIVSDCGERRRLDRLFLLCPLSVQLLHTSVLTQQRAERGAHTGEQLD